MKEKNISQYKLLKSGIDNKTLDSLKKNNNITLLTLYKLSKILDEKDLNKIVRFIDNEQWGETAQLCYFPSFISDSD